MDRNDFLAGVDFVCLTAYLIASVLSGALGFYAPALLLVLAAIGHGASIVAIAAKEAGFGSAYGGFLTVSAVLVACCALSSIGYALWLISRLING